MEAGLIGFDTEEYAAQEHAWALEKHDRELLECLALTSPTFERAYDLLGQANYQEYVNDAMLEGTTQGSTIEPNRPKIYSQRERAEILFKAMKPSQHGTFFSQTKAISLVGAENLSQVISTTRKMLSKENIILLHHCGGGYYLLTE